MTLCTVRRCVAWGLLATTSLRAAHAMPAPAGIESGFNLLSMEQDIEIGRRSAAEIERQVSIVHDPSVDAYVGAIGRRLAAEMPGATFPYQFRVVDASDIEAFALPGGYVYLTRGLMTAVTDEGQLAWVLAHAMSHVALRHGSQQVSRAYVGQEGLGILGGLLVRDAASSERMIQAVGGFGPNPLFLKFSRTDEEQADLVAAQALAKAGYDPQDRIDFIEALEGNGSGDASLEGGLGEPAPTVQEVPPDRPAPPSSKFRTFQSRNRLFRIEYPSNWQPYESADGLAVTLAPAGGFVDGDGDEKDLIYGAVVRHYAPFLSQAGGGPITVAAAHNDVVRQVIRTNPNFRRVLDSERSDTMEGRPALSLVLWGRSEVTGEDECVTVVTREVSPGHVVFALFIAPGKDYGEIKESIARMMGSLRVNGLGPRR